MNTCYFFEMMAGGIPVRVIAFTEEQARKKVEEVYPNDSVKVMSITEYWMPAHSSMESMAKSFSKMVDTEGSK